MRQDDIYIHRTDPSYVVSVTEVRDGAVSFAAEGGGFVKSCLLAKFENDFRPEMPEDRAKRLAYVKEAVQLEWDDPELRIPAWTNGRYWNGWAMPAFERQDLLKAIESKLIDVQYYEPADMFVSVMALDGHDVLPVFDREKLHAEMAERAAAGDHYVETKIGGVDVGIDLYPGEDIPTADGGTVRTYAVGAGSWCWERYNAPEDVSKPSP